jgi:hypothetical protein
VGYFNKLYMCAAQSYIGRVVWNIGYSFIFVFFEKETDVIIRPLLDLYEEQFRTHGAIQYK